MVSVVEDQAVTLFEKRDAADLNTLSKASPRLFIIGILDQLSHGRNKDFNRCVILASNDSVTKLTSATQFPEAYDIAHLGFLYASKHDGYSSPRAISMGFKLASLLVGRDGAKCADGALRRKMLELSNRIVKKIVEICKKLDINFAQVQLGELSHLSVLLGEQEDYETLEWLLTTLWQTREYVYLFSFSPLALNSLPFFFVLTSPQRPTHLATRRPARPRPPPNLRPLPRRPPRKSNPPRRRHSVQHAARARRALPRDPRNLRPARAALHVDGADVPGAGGQGREDGGAGARVL